MFHDTTGAESIFAPARQVRQGDVLLVPASRPGDAKPVGRDCGRVVLAYGEVTGHAHAIRSHGATLLASGRGSLPARARPGDTRPRGARGDRGRPGDLPRRHPARVRRPRDRPAVPAGHRLMGGPRRPEGEALLAGWRRGATSGAPSPGSTEPADRGRAEAAIGSLYGAAGKAAPTFVWVPSPAAGLSAYAFAALGHRAVISPGRAATSATAPTGSSTASPSRSGWSPLGHTGCRARSVTGSRRPACRARPPPTRSRAQPRPSGSAGRSGSCRSSDRRLREPADRNSPVGPPTPRRWMSRPGFSGQRGRPSWSSWAPTSRAVCSRRRRGASRRRSSPRRAAGATGSRRCSPGNGTPSPRCSPRRGTCSGAPSGIRFADARHANPGRGAPRDRQVGGALMGPRRARDRLGAAPRPRSRRPRTAAFGGRSGHRVG